MASLGRRASRPRRARRAGRVGIGTVYRHFPTKEARFQAILALARTGIDVRAATSQAARELRGAFGALLARAQRAGAVRDDVDRVMAVLAGACLAAEHANWDGGLRDSALAIIFDGLRPAGRR